MHFEARLTRYRPKSNQHIGERLHVRPLATALTHNTWTFSLSNNIVVVIACVSFFHLAGVKRLAERQSKPSCQMFPPCDVVHYSYCAGISAFSTHWRCAFDVSVAPLMVST